MAPAKTTKTKEQREDTKCMNHMFFIHPFIKLTIIQAQNQSQFLL